MKRLKQLKGTIACDTETTGLSIWKGDRPFAIGFCDETGHKAFYRGQVDPFTRRVTWASEIVEEIQAVFDNPSAAWVFHNSKFDLGMLGSIGLQVAGKVHDTVFAAHCCNSLEPSFHLKDLSKKYLKYGTEDVDRLRLSIMKARRQGKKLGWKLHEELIADCFLGDRRLLQEYCLSDVERTILLWIMYREWMPKIGVQRTYEEELELQAVATIPMEQRGIRIRERTLYMEIKRHERRRDKWKAELDKLARGVNLRSPKQLGELIYGDGTIPIQHYTDSGKPSTDNRTLEELKHPVARALVKYRAMEKALSSFFYQYRDLAVRDERSGYLVLHPDFQQVGPVTGRYSCRRPNLQNVANALTTRSSEPIQARTPLGPRPGYVWWHPDYSQLEVRIFADVAQEEFMLEALRLDRDLHTECGNKAWGGVDNPAAVEAAIHALELDGSGQQQDERVRQTLLKLRRQTQGKTDEHLAKVWLSWFDWDVVKAEASLGKKTTRAKAKMLLFLKTFGGGPAAAAGLMEVSQEKAEVFLSDYDRAFPGIPRYIRQMSNQAELDGFIINRFGRRTAVDPDKSYRAVNYMVQGSAASFLKNRMVAAAHWCRFQRETAKRDFHLVMTIHDELVFEVPVRYAYWRGLLESVKTIMEDHSGHFTIPMPVEFAITETSWAKKTKVKLEDL